jgi:GTPase SAR1 family protein
MSSLEAKIVVLGSQGVGKTSLVMRYCKGAFNPTQITSTVGASFMTKRVVDSDTDTLVRLQIWDTGTCFSFFSCLPSSGFFFGFATAARAAQPRDGPRTGVRQQQ